MEEPWIERLIREAIERKELEPQEGIGDPIPDLDDTYDPNWWAKRWVERERLKEHLGRGRAPRGEAPRDPEDP
ncbi:MAG: hypothetical protein BMS9Abin07_1795 [Acidimicrobiia bacterium]|nr:MAG: hypothetical protein BMS9Abin07_1795 [Acidimicrobiia bacterium]